MALPKEVLDAVDRVNHCELHSFDYDWQTILAHLMSQEAEIAKLREIVANCANEAGAMVGPNCSTQFLADVPKEIRSVCRLSESRRAAADALLLRYCVQIGELTKGLDPHDPIYIDIQRIGADYMIHLQGAGDEA